MPDKLTDVTDNKVGKITDSEIVKALECCVKDDILEANNNACLECPMNDDNACTFNLRKQTLDLINRLEFKNCQLEKQVSEIQNANLIDFNGTIANYKAENESLKAEIERLKTNLNVELDNFASEYDDKIKAEAYKECIEKVKENMPSSLVYISSDMIENIIDNLLNELEGENNPHNVDKQN